MLTGGTVISSIEYHGCMSLVIFMAGCPLRCRFCHNIELLEGGKETSLDEIKNEIDSAADFIDAVVVSGGEPLLQVDDTADILKHAKFKGLKTKIDISGVYPDKLKLLLDEDLLDAVSLDVKAPFDKYKNIVGSNVGKMVETSMNFVNEYDNIELELRTTFVPTLLTKKDIEVIAKHIKGDIFTLQQFRNKNVLDPKLDGVENPNAMELKKLANSLDEYFNGTIRLKTAEFGNEIIHD